MELAGKQVLQASMPCRYNMHNGSWYCTWPEGDLWLLECDASCLSPNDNARTKRACPELGSRAGRLEYDAWLAAFL